jgi:hypothetical protein
MNNLREIDEKFNDLGELEDRIVNFNNAQLGTYLIIKGVTEDGDEIAYFAMLIDVVKRVKTGIKDLMEKSRHASVVTINEKDREVFTKLIDGVIAIYSKL